ncbi:GNAT family N-acetyltransferase [Robertmurraya andreesenii]|uniref:N-acetyltransferase domain-containing protein n=1 Tax=Anoxybacillus andreesenii TaxID=1325932 RepID=A0ABT9V7K3_9BACL|nr:GNAT family N-acetyltransferase [Robertmurraya andreesenii]MDQ0156912.1 hypothetical protein [Robertmurraya andreesenii]
MELKKLTKAEYIEKINGFVDLFQVCFNKEIPENFLKWRYIENPVDDFFVYVAMDNNKIIANYSVSPIILSSKDGDIKSALSMTTMTHPSYSGRGLFTKLASLLYEDMQRLGYKLVWGFPNSNSHRAFVTKLEWRDIYEIPTMRINLKNRTQLHKTTSIEINQDNEFDLNYGINNYNDLIRVKKDNLYLKWRYFSNPLNNYKNIVITDNGDVSSFLIFKYFGENEIDIVDFSFKTFEEGECLLRQIIICSQDEEIDYINSWAPRHSVNHTLFEKFGFMNHMPITYFGKRDLLYLNERISSDFSNWFIQMGDSDVF